VNDLQSSSEHREKGLMSPGRRWGHLLRILAEMRTPPDLFEPPNATEAKAAQDLCFRLYSAEVADLMAARLGVDRQRVREALDAALQ
jgi:hypothetical protein